MSKQLLIVDDDASVRLALKKVLEAEGFEVTLAANGPAAEAGFSPEETDLVILDLNLPGQSGWDLFERFSRQSPSTPIMVITALPQQSRLAQAAGADALLEKPLDVPVLLETIQQLLTEPLHRHLRRLSGQDKDLRYVPAPDGPAKALAAASEAFATPRFTR